MEESAVLAECPFCSWTPPRSPGAPRASLPGTECILLCMFLKECHSDGPHKAKEEESDVRLVNGGRFSFLGPRS